MLMNCKGSLIGKESDKSLLRIISTQARRELGVRLEYNEVDTCSAEFKALTPYLYSTTILQSYQLANMRIRVEKF